MNRFYSFIPEIIIFSVGSTSGLTQINKKKVYIRVVQCPICPTQRAGPVEDI